MALHKSLTTVTPLSKAIAMILFIALPFLGFYVGTQYQELIDSQNVQIVNTNRTAINHPTPSRDSTVEWKIYTNPASGYSLKYPPMWNIFPRPTDVELNPDVYLQKYNHGAVNVLSVTSYKNIDEKNSRRGTDALPEKSIWEQNLPFETITVGGKNAKLITRKLSLWETYILIPYEKGFVEITWTDVSSKEEQKTFDQILSTFKFLE